MQKRRIQLEYIQYIDEKMRPLEFYYQTAVRFLLVSNMPSLTKEDLHLLLLMLLPDIVATCAVLNLQACSF